MGVIAGTAEDNRALNTCTFLPVVYSEGPSFGNGHPCRSEVWFDTVLGNIGFIFTTRERSTSHCVC